MPATSSLSKVPLSLSKPRSLLIISFDNDYSTKNSHLTTFIKTYSIDNNSDKIKLFYTFISPNTDIIF